MKMTVQDVGKYRAEWELYWRATTENKPTAA